MASIAQAVPEFTSRLVLGVSQRGTGPVSRTVRHGCPHGDCGDPGDDRHDDFSDSLRVPGRVVRHAYFPRGSASYPEVGGAIALVTGVGAAYVLASAWLFLDTAELHFLWNIGAFFLVFYALSAITNYSAVTIFAILISVAVPLWDRHLPAETNVEDTLWLVYGSLIGCAITALVELAFAQIRPRDQVVGAIADRLASVEELLAFYLEGRPVDAATENRITRFPCLGLRDCDEFAAFPLLTELPGTMGAVIALTGNL